MAAPLVAIFAVISYTSIFRNFGEKSKTGAARAIVACATNELEKTFFLQTAQHSAMNSGS